MGKMDFSTALALFIPFLITVHFLLSWWKHNRRYRSLPPGPTPLPFLGTPQYMNQYTTTLNYPVLREKYGSIFTIWMLREPVVVLCGYELVKDALISCAEEFSERPILPTLEFPTKGYDINGRRWRPLRRYLMSSLRNFGMGKKTMETRVLKEAVYVTQVMNETEGKPFNPLLTVASAVGNIMSTWLFGEHFEYKDPKLHDLMEHTSRHIRTILSPAHMFLNLFPVFLNLPIVPNTVFKDQIYLQKLVQKYIDEHKRTLNPEAPRDFIDHFLLKIKEVEHEEDPDFCDLSLLNTLVGMLAAGSETTASTLKFCLVVIAHFPDIQEKVQQEIDEVTQSLRPPEYEDRPQMSYTNAVIHEMQRLFDLASTALFHAVTKDIEFHGYTLPKGTIVHPFLTSVLNDPSQWETPDTFNPGHFLDEEGQFRNHPAFMPFSAGKRVCSGENLARMEIFLLFSALLQKFTFKLPPGVERQGSKWLNANKRDIVANAQLCAVPRISPTDTSTS